MAECELFSFSKLGCWRCSGKCFGNVFPNRSIPFLIRMWLWSIIYLLGLKQIYTFQNISLFSLFPNCKSLVSASAECLRQVMAAIPCISKRWNNLKEMMMSEFFITIYYMNAHLYSHEVSQFQCLTSCKKKIYCLLCSSTIKCII